MSRMKGRQVIALAAATALFVTALGVGLTVRALQQAQTRKLSSYSLSNCRQFVVAVMAYATEHNDAIPGPSGPIASGHDVLKFMTEPPGADSPMLDDLIMSPYGPAPDGLPDYATLRPADTTAAISYPDKAVLVIDRAAFLTDQKEIPVAFADGSTRAVPRGEFDLLLQYTGNERLLSDAKLLKPAAPGSDP